MKPTLKILKKKDFSMLEWPTELKDYPMIGVCAHKGKICVFKIPNVDYPSLHTSNMPFLSELNIANSVLDIDVTSFIANQLKITRVNEWIGYDLKLNRDDFLMRNLVVVFPSSSNHFQTEATYSKVTEVSIPHDVWEILLLVEQYLCLNIPDPESFEDTFAYKPIVTAPFRLEYAQGNKFSVCISIKELCFYMHDLSVIDFFCNDKNYKKVHTNYFNIVYQPDSKSSIRIYLSAEEKNQYQKNAIAIYQHLYFLANKNRLVNFDKTALLFFYKDLIGLNAASINDGNVKQDYAGMPTVLEDNENIVGFNKWLSLFQKNIVASTKYIIGHADSINTIVNTFSP